MVSEVTSASSLWFPNTCGLYNLGDQYHMECSDSRHTVNWRTSPSPQSVDSELACTFCLQLAVSTLYQVSRFCVIQSVIQTANPMVIAHDFSVKCFLFCRTRRHGTQCWEIKHSLRTWVVVLAEAVQAGKANLCTDCVSIPLRMEVCFLQVERSPTQATCHRVTSCALGEMIPYWEISISLCCQQFRHWHWQKLHQSGEMRALPFLRTHEESPCLPLQSLPSCTHFANDEVTNVKVWLMSTGCAILPSPWFGISSMENTLQFNM